MFVTISDRALLQAIETLVERKRSGEELDIGSQDPVLTAFIHGELRRLQELPFEKPLLAPPEKLNVFFRDVVASGR